MIVAIRNQSGYDLFLAVIVKDKSIRFTLYSSPEPGVKTHRMRNGKGFGKSDCPEKIRTHVDVSHSKISLHVSRKKDRLERLDPSHEADGDEMYLLITLRLAN